MILSEELRSLAMRFNFFEAMRENKIVGKFGISYLDETLCGIMKGDLVLVGARAGAGKSSFANMIARTNRTNKNIALFSLENFQNDLPMEQAYRYYLSHGGKYCTMREFASGEVLRKYSGNEKEIARLLGEASEYANKTYSDISVYNRQAGFNVEKLVEAMVKEANNGTELFIIDHLTYIDKMYTDESDIEHMTVLMRTIRQIQDEKKVAVVGVAHLRKPLTSKEMPVIPSMDEFMGSSNMVKESTVCILLAPDDDGNKANVERGQETLKRTWCCIRKNRYGGISNKAANLFFDINSGEYRQSYELYSVNYSGTKTESLGFQNKGDL